MVSTTDPKSDAVRAPFSVARDEGSRMKVRKSARIVVLDPAGAVLLVRYQDPLAADPSKPELLTYWVPPGGGVDEGESYERAAIRELEEENRHRAFGSRPADLVPGARAHIPWRAQDVSGALLHSVGQTLSPVTEPNRGED
jgi:8-oxo-dGTP pyrophosphatase MutT (NUDIX family)